MGKPTEDELKEFFRAVRHNPNLDQTFELQAEFRAKHKLSKADMNALLFRELGR